MRLISTTHLSLRQALSMLLTFLPGSANARVDLKNKPHIFDGLDILGSKLAPKLPSKRTAKMINWSSKFIPEFCEQDARKWGWSASDITTFNATYNDCDTPWVFCRHKDAETSQTDMVKQFGRLPVGMRDYVRHVIVYPGPGRRAHAFTGPGDIVIFGDVRESAHTSVWAHEVAHCVDNHSGPGGNGDFSATQTWLDAFEKDMAVTDPYATSTQAENFAQTVVAALYDKANHEKGGIYSVGGCRAQWRIRNQIEAAQAKLGDKLLQVGRCARGIVNISSPVIHIKPPPRTIKNRQVDINTMTTTTTTTVEFVSLAEVPANYTAAARDMADYRGPDMDLPLAQDDQKTDKSWNCSVPLLGKQLP